jgi:cysteine desulfurase/selenocysteine lyase
MIEMPALDVNRIRKDFPILKKMVNGKRLVYLDSAATSQKPRQVIDAVSGFYENCNANIHRGMYELSEEATAAYTRSKELAAGLINAGSYRSIVYVRNATEAINLVARTWAEENLRKGDRVLITEMEHHSNIVPWQMLAKRKGVRLEYAQLEDGKFVDMDDYREKLEKGPKLVSFTHVSNVLGTINDAKEMTRLAHKAGAKVLLDAAQSVPHLKVDVKDIDCDFMAFSSHKMLGPSGVGVLYGKEDLLDAMPPLFGGGDMIRSVSEQESTWNDLPWKFEAGTQNMEGAVGFGAAIEYLGRLGMGNVRKHEIALTRYALDLLAKDRGVKVYGPGREDMRRRAGVIAFGIDGAPAHDVASIFDSEGIAVRAGHHCAMPLLKGALHTHGVPRMSFYVYNTEDEVDKAIAAIGKVRKVLGLGR